MSSEAELAQLRRTIAVATNSWQEAEVARQVATRESNAAQQALLQLEKDPHAAASNVSEEEEHRLRQQLEVIQNERERKVQLERLHIDAARSARAAAAAEAQAKLEAEDKAMVVDCGAVRIV